jgi:hypothetical protein
MGELVLRWIGAIFVVTAGLYVTVLVLVDAMELAASLVGHMLGGVVSVILLASGLLVAAAARAALWLGGLPRRLACRADAQLMAYLPWCRRRLERLAAGLCVTSLAVVVAGCPAGYLACAALMAALSVASAALAHRARAARPRVTVRQAAASRAQRND